MPAAARVAFFGTPEFALPTLAALVESGRPPAIVVTRPARPAGRGRQMQEPPVARWARRHGLPVAQPRRVGDPEFLAALRALDPEVAVVAAFGQIFPRSLLAVPRLGCVNLHGSLLPRWRGAGPVAAAIAAGDPVTGVTTMLMEEALDSGPILLQEEARIGQRETAAELGARLAALGGPLVVRTLEALERGAIQPRPQDESQASYAPRLQRADARADWAAPAAALDRRLRAQTPWPGLESTLRGAPVKFLRARPAPRPADGAPGEILGLDDSAIRVACGDGSALLVEELQRPGRRALSGSDFWNGERLRPGERLG
jgi:methionyl-tRNA formyltransferase